MTSGNYQIGSSWFCFRLLCSKCQHFMPSKWL